jgi:TonB-linked SusC/RagA family outer membrane protein
LNPGSVSDPLPYSTKRDQFMKKLVLANYNNCLILSCLILLSCLQSIRVFAQDYDKTVSGIISDLKTGEPLIGATIVVKGFENTGTVSGLDGNYTLNLPEGSHSLIFSYIGYESKEIEVGERVEIDVWLNEAINPLDEVVITAVGIAAGKRALGYSIEKVDSREIENTGETNIVSALSGKTAGVFVTSSSGSPGASANIRIRGNKSINGSNKPLFIVDGIPIDNTSTGNSQVGVDISNRAIDINPNDIESISILKGPAATALYGIRAANGAVIITSKQGSKGKPRIIIESSYGANRVNKLPARQYTYAQGTFSGGRAVYRGPETGQADSYGPKMSELEFDGDPTYLYDRNGRLVPAGNGNGIPAIVYDPFDDFFVTGHTFDNNVSVSGGTDLASYYLSMGNYTQSGIIPKADWTRSSFKAVFKVDLSERLKLGSNTTVVRSGGDRTTRGNALSGVGIGLYRTPVSFDNGNGKTGREAANDPSSYIFNNGAQRAYRGSAEYDNPFWSVNKVLFKDKVNRIIQSAHLDYKITPWLTASYKLGLDNYSDKRESDWDINSGSESLGRIDLGTILSTDINSDLLLLISKDFKGDFSLDATLGHNFFSSDFTRRTIEGRELTKQGFFHISNASDIQTDESIFRRQLFGIFADVHMRWKSILYLNMTGRNDWSSTLPKKNNSFFYPTVSLGFEFTEALGLTNNKWLSYGKIRTSYGEVGNDASLYLTANYFGQADADGDNLLPGNEFPAFGVNAFERSNILGNADLKAETTTTFEIGGDFKFLLGRVNLDITYYKAITTDLIVNAEISAASGFTEAPVNAGEIVNEGIELMVEVVPVQTENFRWDINANFSKSENTVTELPEGIDQLTLSSWSAISSLILEGEPYGVLVGTAYQRNEKNQIIIGADGWPLVNPVQIKVGDPNPDWIAGLRNSFTYKGLRFSALLDVRYGGDIWNGTRGMMNNLGVGEESGRDREVTGYIYEGVTETGEPNTTPVDFANPVNGNTGIKWKKYGSLGLAELHVEDGSWLRLREVALSYTLPYRWFVNTRLNGVSLSVSGRNLWLLTNYSGIDPETNLSGDSNTTGWDYFNLPNTKGIMGSVSLTF